MNRCVVITTLLVNISNFIIKMVSWNYYTTTVAINNFAKTKTIIIVAHRLSTVQKCDKLYLVDNGHVVDSGNYEYLLQNNKEFLEMATIIN